MSTKEDSANGASKMSGSTAETIARFGTPAAAEKYSRSLVGTRTHQRETRCILLALASLKPGARVLDLPCGTGRLLPALAGCGFHVTEADSSPHMVELARRLARTTEIDSSQAAFEVANVHETGFKDDSFDAVVCNRLFHHLREPDARQKALAELRRISRGPVVASFFSNRSLDAAIFHLRQALRGRPATDRIPISPRSFETDAGAAGLMVTRWLSPRPWISRQCYAVLARASS